MALDWRDIKTSNIEIVKMQDSEGRLLAVARAGRHFHGTPAMYGCSWDSYEQNGDLSCGSRYYEVCDLFPIEEEEIEAPSPMRSEAEIELDIRRVIGSIQGNAIMGVSIERYLAEIEALRLEMSERINADFEAELAAD